MHDDRGCRGHGGCRVRAIDGRKRAVTPHAASTARHAQQHAEIEEQTNDPRHRRDENQTAVERHIRAADRAPPMRLLCLPDRVEADAEPGVLQDEAAGAHPRDEPLSGRRVVAQLVEASSKGDEQRQERKHEHRSDDEDTEQPKPESAHAGKDDESNRERENRRTRHGQQQRRAECDHRHPRLRQRLGDTRQSEQQRDDDEHAGEIRVENRRHESAALHVPRRQVASVVNHLRKAGEKRRLHDSSDGENQERSFYISPRIARLVRREAPHDERIPPEVGDPSNEKRGDAGAVDDTEIVSSKR